MHILTGLFDHGVLQRTDKNISDQPITGETTGSGAVFARVTKGGKKVRGLDGVIVGKVGGGKFKARLTGVPVGGPYNVELHTRTKDGKTGDKVVVKDVLVGDVWMAGGQSNMQGCGRFVDRAKKHPLVRAFYMDDHWAVAEDPIHQLEIAVDHVHNGGNRLTTPNKNNNGVGPAVAFAQEMHRRHKVPQGILACAHGGTSMSQWDPKLLPNGGRSLYGASIRRLEKNGGRVKGIIWYQGESDANRDAAALYTGRMKELVRAYRRDAGDPSLPFVAVQIGRVLGDGWMPGGPWNSIQDQQYRLSWSIRDFAEVPSIDLALDDVIHIGGKDQQRLGVRLAYAMDALLHGKRAGKPPIKLKRIRTSSNPVIGLVDFTIEFENVVGGLRSAAGVRPTGFYVADRGSNKPLPVIYDTKLDGDTVTLHTILAPHDIGEKTVYYGLGTDPVCNITDQADRSLPVLGPEMAGEPRALTAMTQTLRVAFPVDLPEGVDAKLNNLQHPTDLNSLPLGTRTFNARFADLHLEIGKLAPRDFIVYYACRIDVPEAMKLSANIGYDGPVKVWIDGRELFHDPAGTNPAFEDKARVTFDATPGQHDVLIALGSNQCKAWGVFLRFERPDIPKARLRKQDTSFAMPTVLG